MDFLGKKYKFVKGDSLEETFKAVGHKINTPSPTALAQEYAAPTAELVSNGDSTFTLSVGTPAGSLVRTFTPGQPIEEDMWGEKFQSTYTVEASRLTQVQTAPNGKVLTIIRDFTPTSLTATNTVSGWDGKCVRYYEAI